jgi:hypothetical protein
MNSRNYFTSVRTGVAFRKTDCLNNRRVTVTESALPSRKRISKPSRTAGIGDTLWPFVQTNSIVRTGATTDPLQRRRARRLAVECKGGFVPISVQGDGTPHGHPVERRGPDFLAKTGFRLARLCHNCWARKGFPLKGGNLASIRARLPGESREPGSFFHFSNGF